MPSLADPSLPNCVDHELYASLETHWSFETDLRLAVLTSAALVYDFAQLARGENKGEGNEGQAGGRAGTEIDEVAKKVFNGSARLFKAQREVKFRCVKTFVDFEVALIEAPNAVVLAFCGTEPFEIQDWLTDLGTWADTVFNPREYLVPFEEGDDVQVHAGFLAHLKAHGVWDDVRAEVGRILDARPRPLFLTGHSLGGALATLAAFDIARNDGPLLRAILDGGGVLTMGAAGAGNLEFKDAFERVEGLAARVTHFVSGDEFAPRLPPGVGVLPGANWFFVDPAGGPPRTMGQFEESIFKVLPRTTGQSVHATAYFVTMTLPRVVSINFFPDAPEANVRRLRNYVEHAVVPLIHHHAPYYTLHALRELINT
ncbi:hypothetical protein CTAYLR_001683 [Chrysophaeum taylorii]|uniref:Fungal lipase-type domain-containing protein n=1 Tax=Chrysophaeum taylorii TaxID=2483200 RepID=A0AAD7U7L5_9STRA|nr:hypothetical protein CTAYLR_001683 [Chrysophaeum taylorii]